MAGDWFVSALKIVFQNTGATECFVGILFVDILMVFTEPSLFNLIKLSGFAHL